MQQRPMLGNSDTISTPTFVPLSILHNQAHFGFASLFVIGLAGCVTNDLNDGVFTDLNSITEPVHVQSKTRSSAGHFLAARQALYFNDIDESANFFLETLRGDSDNAALLRQAFMTQYYQGNISEAATLARQMEQRNISTAFSAEPATAIAIQDRDWQAVIVLADIIREHSPSRQLAALIKAWALIATGQGDSGITHLTKTQDFGAATKTRLALYIELHAAMMAEFLGQTDEATKRGLQLVETQMSPLAALHLAGLLARNGEQKAAEKLVSYRLTTNFNRTIIDTLLSLEATNEPPSLLTNMVNGIVDFSLLAQGDPEQRTLSARLHFAQFLDPENEVARLLLAQQQIKTSNYDDAIENLSAIKVDGFLGQPAMITLSNIANERGQFTEAASILQKAIAINPEDGYLYKLLGDAHRRSADYIRGKNAYETALEMGHSTSDLHRNLGVALERLNQTQAAEKHLKLALEMNPDDAFALNYLGYWWADQGRNLDEAIALIKRAVQLRPSSGYFVDSLGWVHFRLGDAEKAVQFLEKATELEPADSEIAGHLGDVYWYLGRHDEARFKWRLAKSLSVEQKEKNKFSSRINSGLPSSESDILPQ